MEFSFLTISYIGKGKYNINRASCLQYFKATIHALSHFSLKEKADKSKMSHGKLVFTGPWMFKWNSRKIIYVRLFFPSKWYSVFIFSSCPWRDCWRGRGFLAPIPPPGEFFLWLLSCAVTSLWTPENESDSHDSDGRRWPSGHLNSKSPHWPRPD